MSGSRAGASVAELSVSPESDLHERFGLAKCIVVAFPCTFAAFTARGGSTAVCGGAAYVVASASDCLRPVSDGASVLSRDEVRKLSESVDEIRRRSGVRVAIVIVDTTAPESGRDYAERLALRWERDRAIDLDRSIFLVVSLKDRELQVLPGNALAFLDQEFARPGAYEDLPPLFREGHYFEALFRLNKRILDILVKRDAAVERYRTK